MNEISEIIIFFSALSKMNQMFLGTVLNTQFYECGIKVLDAWTVECSILSSNLDIFFHETTPAGTWRLCYPSEIKIIMESCKRTL